MALAGSAYVNMRRTKTGNRKIIPIEFVSLTEPEIVLVVKVLKTALRLCPAPAVQPGGHLAGSGQSGSRSQSAWPGCRSPSRGVQSHDAQATGLGAPGLPRMTALVRHERRVYTFT